MGQNRHLAQDAGRLAYYDEDEKTKDRYEPSSGYESP
jgi:hypothetical protein